MARGTKSRSTALCVGAVIALIAIAPAAATAASNQAAVEEYVLTLPGVDVSSVGESDPIVKRGQQVDPVGVVGERDGSVTALGAVGTALATPGGAMLLAVIAGGGAIALTTRRRSRR